MNDKTSDSFPYGVSVEGTSVANQDILLNTVFANSLQHINTNRNLKEFYIKNFVIEPIGDGMIIQIGTQPPFYIKPDVPFNLSVYNSRNLRYPHEVIKTINGGVAFVAYFCI